MRSQLHKPGKHFSQNANVTISVPNKLIERDRRKRRPLIAGVRPHMLWVILPVVAVALAVPAAARYGMPRWGWLILATVITSVECAFYGKASPSWELQHVIASWVFLILLPWAAVAMHLWFSRYPAQPVGTALGVPFVYVLALVVGFVVGDMSGLVPQ